MPETKKPRRGESRQGFGNEISFEEEIVMNEHTEVNEKFNAGAVKGPVTEEHLFGFCNVERQELFAIRPGIPAEDALDEVICILSEVRSSLESAGTGQEGISPGQTWGLFRSLGMAMAIVESTHLGLGKLS